MSNTTANSSSSSLSYRAPTEYTPWKDGQTLEQILANAKILEESEPGAGRAYMRDVIRSREEQIAPSSTSEDDQNVCAGPVNCEEPPADGILFPSLGNVLCAPPEPELVAEERKRRKEEREKAVEKLKRELNMSKQRLKYLEELPISMELKEWRQIRDEEERKAREEQERAAAEAERARLQEEARLERERLHEENMARQAKEAAERHEAAERAEAEAALERARLAAEAAEEERKKEVARQELMKRLAEEKAELEAKYKFEEEKRTRKEQARINAAKVALVHKEEMARMKRESTLRLKEDTARAKEEAKAQKQRAKLERQKSKRDEKQAKRDEKQAELEEKRQEELAKKARERQVTLDAQARLEQGQAETLAVAAAKERARLHDEEEERKKQRVIAEKLLVLDSKDNHTSSSGGMFDLSVFCDFSCDPGDLFTLKVGHDEAAAVDVVPDGMMLVAPTGPPQKFPPGTVVWAYRSACKTVPAALRGAHAGTVLRSHPCPTSPADAVDGTFDIMFDDGLQMYEVDWGMIRMLAPKPKDEAKEAKEAAEAEAHAAAAAAAEAVVQAQLQAEAAAAAVARAQKERQSRAQKDADEAAAVAARAQKESHSRVEAATAARAQNDADEASAAAAASAAAQKDADEAAAREDARLDEEAAAREAVRLAEEAAAREAVRLAEEAAAREAVRLAEEEAERERKEAERVHEEALLKKEADAQGMLKMLQSGSIHEVQAAEWALSADSDSEDSEDEPTSKELVDRNHVRSGSKVPMPLGEDVCADESSCTVM